MRRGLRIGIVRSIGAKRARRLALRLALLCLLLSLRGHGGLRRRPPVSMRRIHDGFTRLAGFKEPRVAGRVNALEWLGRISAW